MNTQYLLAIIFLINLALSPTAEDNDKSISLSFNKVTFVDDQEVEKIDGSIYVVGQNEAYINITHPLNQKLIIKNNILTIYYPDKNRAFEIIGQAQKSIPLLSSFLRATEPDFGLSDIGYQMEFSEFKSDTLITKWVHPSGDEALRPIRVYEVDTKIVKVSATVDNEEIETHFTEYHSVNELSLPMTIKSNKDLVTELLRFRDLRALENVTDIVDQFKIPEDANVTHYSY